MLEELYVWGSQMERRWGIMRRRGRWHYILLRGAVFIGGSLAFVATGLGVIIRGTLDPFPWELPLMHFLIWPTAAGIFAAARWSLHERRYADSRDAEKPAAPNAAIAPQLIVEHHWPGVGEPER